MYRIDKHYHDKWIKWGKVSEFSMVKKENSLCKYDIVFQIIVAFMFIICSKL